VRFALWVRFGISFSLRGKDGIHDRAAKNQIMFELWLGLELGLMLVLGLELGLDIRTIVPLRVA